MKGRTLGLLAFAVCLVQPLRAADVVRPIGEGPSVIVPVAPARDLTGLVAQPVLGQIPALAVPSIPSSISVPDAPAPVIVPQSQTAGTVVAPAARPELDQAASPAAPETAAAPDAIVETGRQVFDGQGKQDADAAPAARRESVVHLHHDGQQTHAHFEHYHRDEASHGENFRRPGPPPAPFPIPARLEPYLPSAAEKNPQDWSGRATLHLHSIYSDGTMTPEAVIEGAYQKGVRVVSLTDHDTSAGVQRAYEKVKELNRANPTDPMEFHPGIEMTARGGAHIGAVDVDISNPKLVALLERVRLARYQKAKGMIDNLNALDELKQKGITLTIDEVKAFSQHDAGGTIEIPHIARALVKHGLIEHVDDAYDTYLKGDIFTVPGVAADPTADEVVETIHDAGGKAFLNHPYTVRGQTDAEKDAAVEQMLGLGMDGIEVYRPSHATSENGKRQADERAAKYILWTEKYNLMVGNGADFHGTDTHLDQMVVMMHKEFEAKLEAGLRDANQKAIASLERQGAQPAAPAKNLARMLAFIPFGAAKAAGVTAALSAGTLALWLGAGVVIGIGLGACVQLLEKRLGSSATEAGMRASIFGVPMAALALAGFLTAGASGALIVAAGAAIGLGGAKLAMAGIERLFGGEFTGGYYPGLIAGIYFGALLLAHLL